MKGHFELRSLDCILKGVELDMRLSNRDDSKIFAPNDCGTREPKCLGHEFSFIKIMMVDSMHTELPIV